MMSNEDLMACGYKPLLKGEKRLGIWVYYPPFDGRDGYWGKYAEGDNAHHIEELADGLAKVSKGKKRVRYQDNRGDMWEIEKDGRIYKHVPVIHEGDSGRVIYTKQR